MEMANGVLWRLCSVDFVDVDGRPIWSWADEVPGSNPWSSTALTPPVMDGIGRFAVTHTVETEPSEPIDIDRVMREIESLEAYRDAECQAQQFFRDATVLGIAQLVADGHMDEARAVAAGTRDLLWDDVYKVRLPPDDFLPAYLRS